MADYKPWLIAAGIGGGAWLLWRRFAPADSGSLASSLGSNVPSNNQDVGYQYPAVDFSLPGNFNQAGPGYLGNLGQGFNLSLPPVEIPPLTVPAIGGAGGGGGCSGCASDQPSSSFGALVASILQRNPQMPELVASNITSAGYPVPANIPALSSYDTWAPLSVSSGLGTAANPVGPLDRGRVRDAVAVKEPGLTGRISAAGFVPSVLGADGNYYAGGTPDVTVATAGSLAAHPAGRR